MSPWKIRHNDKIEVYLEVKLNYIKMRENEKYIFSFAPKFYLTIHITEIKQRLSLVERLQYINENIQDIT